METCVGKTDDEIWRTFRDHHAGGQVPEHALRQIHVKWVGLLADVTVGRKGKSRGKKKK